MPTFANWARRDNPNVTAERAARAWERIQDKAASVTVYRGGNPQAAQTVRLEWQNTPTERRTDTGQSSLRELVILGVAGHPDEAVSDTDLQRGDRFLHAGLNYRIVDVVSYPGEVQAYTERISA